MATALYSLYLHIPFCRHRCGYCDFNTTAGLEALIPAYVDALRREIRLAGRSAGERLPVHTVFFGGGTPSLLPVEAVAGILDEIREHFEVLAGAEISLEANPGTVSLESLQGFWMAGINRLSFGMQSANPAELAFLERQHDVFDVFKAVEWSRRAGFENLSLDLIFGLPGQGSDGWARTIETALVLKPAHLSLYALTVEEGTPLHRWIRRGLVTLPDDDLAAEMYELASERLEAAGFEQYEISNWAARDANGNNLFCRHNLQYWRGLPYLGFGAGAHGYAGGVRTANENGVRAYIQACQNAEAAVFPAGPAAIVRDRLTLKAEMQERMMVGLRLIKEGVSAADFLQRFGWPLEEVFRRQIQKLVAAGLLEWSGENEKALRLTKRGRLLGNRVFMEFVGED
ncbi:MAG: radical SAM family heme chaperone HemW [Anaerolineae bacterium]|nr:radical SAM family heme chaperone HemW [Anaerolineae bacterium]